MLFVKPKKYACDKHIIHIARHIKSSPHGPCKFVSPHNTVLLDHVIPVLSHIVWIGARNTICDADIIREYCVIDVGRRSSCLRRHFLYFQTPNNQWYSSGTGALFCELSEHNRNLAQNTQINTDFDLCIAMDRQKYVLQFWQV